jgi:hypothetical protein
MLPISSSEDSYGPSCLRVPARGLVLATQVIRSEKQLMRREGMPPPPHCLVVFFLCVVFQVRMLHVASKLIYLLLEL